MKTRGITDWDKIVDSNYCTYKAEYENIKKHWEDKGKKENKIYKVRRLKTDTKGLIMYAVFDCTERLKKEQLLDVINSVNNDHIFFTALIDIFKAKKEQYTSNNGRYCSQQIVNCLKYLCENECNKGGK